MTEVRKDIDKTGNSGVYFFWPTLDLVLIYFVFLPEE